MGEISTGAQNDLQRATDIARSMVTEWGMSERLGAVNFDSGRRSRFLDVPQGPERGPHSEETAKAIDEEVKMIITEGHNDARRILLDRRDILETVTRRLLEKEVMEGDELGEHLGFGGVQLRRLDRAVALDEFDGRQAQPCGERLDVPRSTPDQQVTYDDRDDEHHVGDRRHERHDHDRRHRVNVSRVSPAPGIAAPAN